MERSDLAVRLINNKKELELILFHDDIKDGLNEGHKPPEEYFHPKIKYIGGYCSGKLVAIMIFLEAGEFAYFHLGILRGFRGKCGLELVKLGLRKFEAKFNGTALIARIRHTNRASLKFASWVRFREYSRDVNYVYLGRAPRGRCIRRHNKPF